MGSGLSKPCAGLSVLPPTSPAQASWRLRRALRPPMARTTRTSGGWLAPKLPICLRPVDHGAALRTTMEPARQARFRDSRPSPLGQSAANGPRRHRPIVGERAGRRPVRQTRGRARLSREGNSFPAGLTTQPYRRCCPAASSTLRKSRSFRRPFAVCRPTSAGGSSESHGPRAPSGTRPSSGTLARGALACSAATAARSRKGSSQTPRRGRRRARTVAISRGRAGASPTPSRRLAWPVPRATAAGSPATGSRARCQRQAASGRPTALRTGATSPPP